MQVGFTSQLRKAVQDKVVLKEYFNTFNSAKMTWALSKHQARLITPSYHLDTANVLLSRRDLGKISSVGH